MFIPLGTIVPNSLIHSDSRTCDQSSQYTITLLFSFFLKKVFVYFLGLKYFSVFVGLRCQHLILIVTLRASLLLLKTFSMAVMDMWLALCPRERIMSIYWAIILRQKNFGLYFWRHDVGFWYSISKWSCTVWEYDTPKIRFKQTHHFIYSVGSNWPTTKCWWQLRAKWWHINIICPQQKFYF